ncbi:serine O-acetyltransferase [Flavihumibacter sp. UBA7668]|uniref:serine O-acetyltransferase n=1 Tax=Flavihumibacter sp. UBA7668 TaxID=1946542 RepID=UPI0025B9227A|nr:serine acetyltransferase [Flavihumibacter sp. UBA7668]
MKFSCLLSEIKGDLPNQSFNIKAFFINYFYSARFRVLLNHRIGKFCFQSNSFIIRQISSYYKYKLISKRGCDISYNAIIGRNLRLPHPIGIVIGDGVIIGDNVMLFQQVTLGSHGKKGDKMNYPVVENGVKIFAGAKIIGGVVIGENAVVGANAVVNINVPPDSTAVGIPAKILMK